VDDPNMSLQSTAALATSPLHDISGDGSSLEETSRSPAFRLLMRLSFRSRLAILRSLSCALRAARHLSAAALFRLKITSSGRGALAGTRCAHLSCENKEWKSQQTSKVPEKTSITIKAQINKTSSEETSTYQSLGSLVGKHREQPCWRPRVRRLPDHLRRIAAGSQVAMGGSAPSQSLSRGPGRPSSRRDEADASGAAQLLGRGTAQ
jgi:hypothetical protein